MSNILVVPRFQKLWALTSSLDYAGTATCTGLLTNTAAPLPARPLPPPPWDYLTMTALSLAVPPFYRALALVLSPCTSLLFILGS